MSDPHIFDEEVTRELRRRAKTQLRKRMRAMRHSIPASAREKRDHAILSRVSHCSLFQSASTVALFSPMLHRDEIDVRPLEVERTSVAKRLAYPGFAEDETTPVLRLCSSSQLIDLGRGYLEPPLDAPLCPPSDDLLIIVPCLAADSAGFRLGYGSGYYDRLLAQLCPPARTLAVLYDFQMVAEMPRDETDRAVTALATDTHFYDVLRNVP